MTGYAYSYLQGFLVGMSLIVAIGAQNAFVLTQSIRHNFAHAVAGVCAFLDALLIGIGVCGIGSLVAGNEALRTLTTFGGAVFLFWFGTRSFLSAYRPKALDATAEVNPSLARTLAATLAVSLLNPHVYLDTVVMLGAISGNHPGIGRYAFGLGAATASLIWFFSLSLAGKALAPVFRKPKAWQVLHVVVGLMVWWVAAGLVYAYYTPAPGSGL